MKKILIFINKKKLVVSLYLKSFWYSYILVNKIKRNKTDINSFLDSLGENSKYIGITPKQISNIIYKASKFFWFHKDQQCLARSLTCYLFLKQFSYKPYLVLEINIKKNSFYNCHCWVSLDSDSVKKDYKDIFISCNRNTIFLDSTNGDENGKHNPDRLLQSELPLLLRKKNDGR
ncbi:MAG: hypothetical protein GY714_03355 [Desulfobacterales bacterium]|nr:hypothetical protein [Desulfobacterales bacterium]